MAEGGQRGWPFQIEIKPEVILEERQYINANLLAPRLDYVKRWAPEDWYMAFHGNLHLLPKSDFLLIEDEMKKLKYGRDYDRGSLTPPQAAPRREKAAVARKERQRRPAAATGQQQNPPARANRRRPSGPGSAAASAAWAISRSTPGSFSSAPASRRARSASGPPVLAPGPTPRVPAPGVPRGPGPGATPAQPAGPPRLPNATQAFRCMPTRLARIMGVPAKPGLEVLFGQVQQGGEVQGGQVTARVGWARPGATGWAQREVP